MSVEIKEVILPQIKEFNTMENQGIQEGLEIATLAGGCFWSEAVFLELESTCCYFWLYWGKTIDPTYKEICNGDGTCRSN
jgi:peptide-methionine (S)-S-oxide reductase